MTICERCGNPLGDAWNSIDHLCPPGPSKFVAIGRADQCDWCISPRELVNEDGMCHSCFVQAEEDDRNHPPDIGKPWIDPWDDALAEQTRVENAELEAGQRKAEEAIRRSMDALGSNRGHEEAT